jgi:pilin isopeptide linkage protein
VDGEKLGQTFTNDKDGNIDIKIPLTQEDMGEHTYIISEEKGKDSSIEYSTDYVIAQVTIEEVFNEKGESEVGATSIQYLNDAKTFTNTYKATGSLTMVANKEMKLKTTTGKALSLRNDEFTFEVYEGKNKVATGTNAANGTITFSDLVYDSYDIGEHTYTIKEKKGSEMFVRYADKEYTVTVDVSDAGNGKLNAKVTKVDGTAVADATAAANAIKFTNIYELEIPTGVRMYIMPYILIILLACGFGIAALICKQKRRKHHA